MNVIFSDPNQSRAPSRCLSECLSSGSTSHLLFLFLLSFFFFLLSWAFVFTIALALSYTFCLSCQINMRMTGEPRPWGIALAEWDRSVCVRAPKHGGKLYTDGDGEIWFCVPSASPLTLFCQNCSLVLDLAGQINVICGQKNPNRSLA